MVLGPVFPEFGLALVHKGADAFDTVGCPEQGVEKFFFGLEAAAGESCHLGDGLLGGCDRFPRPGCQPFT